MKKWTDEDEAFLVENYKTLGRKACAEALNRSESSIRAKTSRLGLYSDIKKTWKIKSQEDYEKELENTEYTALEPYVRSNVKILHRHNPCGYTWKVTPNNISKYIGCPQCSTSGHKDGRPHMVYIIEFPILGLCKVGITSNWNRRKYDFGYEPEILYKEYVQTGQEALEIEKAFMDKLNPFMLNTGELKNGNTETFIWPS